jgi:hypothetical protein
MSAELDQQRAAQVKAEREEVKSFQKELRKTGVRLNFHEARNELQSQKQEETRVQNDLEKRLEEAQPEFIRDGKGLRGDQRAIEDVKIDGADGSNGVFQVKKQRGESSAGGPGAVGGTEGLIYFDDADVNGAAASYYLRGKIAP